MKLFSVLFMSFVLVCTPVFAKEKAPSKGKGQQASCPHAKQKGEMMALIEKGDYAAWKAAVDQAGCKCQAATTITQENFPKFVTMHQLQSAGKTAEAQVIASELGLGDNFGMCGEHGKGKPCAHAAKGECPHSKAMGKGAHKGEHKCNHAPGESCPHHKAQ